MIQPKNIVINIGLLLDAMTAAGGLVRFARKCKVDSAKINMLLQGKIPNPGPLFRICQGAQIKPSELIVNAATYQTVKRRRGELVHLRRDVDQIPKNAG